MAQQRWRRWPSFRFDPRSPILILFLLCASSFWSFARTSRGVRCKCALRQQFPRDKTERLLELRSFSSLGGFGTRPVSISERYGLEMPVRPPAHRAVSRAGDVAAKFVPSGSMCFS